MERTASVTVLGPVRASIDGIEIELSPGSRRVLALLCTASGRAMSNARMVDVLWPEADEDAGRNRLRVAISTLRSQFRRSGAPDPVASERGGYRLSSNVTVDSHEFEAKLRRFRTIRSTNASGALENLRQALELFPAGQEPYFEFINHDFANREAQRLVSERGAAGADLLELRLSLEDPGPTPGEVRHELSEHPWNERIHAALAIAEYRAGNRVDALAVVEAARQALGMELGIDTHPALDATEARILARDPGLLPSTRASSVAELSPARPAYSSSFVGRARELEQLGEMVSRPGLTTLVGPGGSGKTRLATEYLRLDQRRIAFADLAAIPPEGQPEPAVAAAIGVELVGQDPVGEIGVELGQAPTLLVLDNCEHLAPKVARFVNGLDGLPDLTILATSRVVLNVDEEQLLALRGLPTDRPSDGAPSDAERLFAERAESQGASLGSPESLALVREISTRADGLPLALELAASWIRALSLEEISDGLASVDLGGPDRQSRDARHGSLSSTIEWSYRLLNDRDREVFRVAGHLEGGFSIDLLGAVMPSIGQAPLRRSLHKLVAHQLIDRLESTNPSRFRMLETVRSFARSIAPIEESELVSSLLRSWAIDLMLDAGPRTDEGGEEVFRGLDLEFSNLLGAAQRGTQDGDGEVAARLVDRLQYYLMARPNNARRALPLAEVALSMIPPDQTDLSLRANLGAGVVSFHVEEFDLALASLRAAVALADDLGDVRRQTSAGKELGRVLMRRGELLGAQRVFREATDLSRGIGQPLYIARELAEQAAAEPPHRQAACLEESFEIARSEDHPVLSAYIGAQQGWFRSSIGEWSRALSSFRLAESEYRSQDNKDTVAEMLWGVADCYRGHGQLLEEEKCLREALALARASGHGASIAISAVRLAERTDFEEPDLLDEASDAAGHRGPTLARLRVAQARFESTLGDTLAAERRAYEAQELVDQWQVPSWRGAVAAMIASIEDDSVDQLARSLRSYQEALEGPFMLEGYGFPELGSLTFIASVVRRYGRATGVELEGSRPVGLAAVKETGALIERALST